MKYNLYVEDVSVEAVFNKLGGIEGVKKFLAGELVLKALELLRRVTSVSVSSAERFVASEFFTTENPDVKFYDFGSNFRDNFLTRIEKNIPAAELAVDQLVRASLDAPILAELGDRAETALAYLAELLKKQPNGEDGILLTNGYANVFYIGDWAVGACWCAGDGWRVNARPVGPPYRWGEGSQFFSRK